MLTGAASAGAGGPGEAADPGGGEWEHPAPEGHPGEGRAGDPHRGHQLRAAGGQPEVALT